MEYRCVLPSEEKSADRQRLSESVASGEIFGLEFATGGDNFRQQEDTGMRKAKRQGRSAALAILTGSALALAACVTETTTQSFRVVKNPELEASYIATDADFSKYDRLLRKDMGIYFPTGASLSDNDLQRIRQIFRTAFMNELTDYTIVETSAAGALAVEATLIDMRSGTYEDVPNMRAGLEGLGQPGELVFLMELKDSRTDYVLGRAADSAQAPSMATGDGRKTDWPAIEAAADHWAAMFRQFLDQNLGDR